VQRGDRVTIYLPMIPEAAVAMLACARIGAMHSIVFGGFSPDALAGTYRRLRVASSSPADESMRGGKKVPLKANVDAALQEPGHELCGNRDCGSAHRITNRYAGTT
jgi:acetyl-CoA synthetase